MLPIRGCHSRQSGGLSAPTSLFSCHPGLGSNESPPKEGKSERSDPQHLVLRRLSPRSRRHALLGRPERLHYEGYTNRSRRHDQIRINATVVLGDELMMMRCEIRGIDLARLHFRGEATPLLGVDVPDAVSKPAAAQASGR